MTTFVKTRTGSLLLSLLVRIITPLSSVVLIPIYVAHLSKDDYGIWLVILGIMNYLGLANFGIAQTVANEVAKARGAQCLDELSDFVSTAWTYYWIIIGVVVSIIIIGFGIFASTEWQNTDSIFIVMALTCLASMPLKLFSVGLRSFERIHDEQAIQAVFVLLRAVLVAFLLLSGRGLLSLAFAYSFLYLLPPLASKLWLRHLHPSLQVITGRFDAKLAGRIFSHSASFFMIQLAGLVAFSTDNLVIAYFLGAESVPDYAVPAQMILLAQGLITSLGIVFYPMVSRSYYMGRLGVLRRMYCSVTFVQLALGVIVSVILYLTGTALLHSFVGTSIVVENNVFCLLLILFVVQLVLSPADMIVMATSNHKRMALIGPLEALLNLVLSVWWVQVWGVAGVVAATIAGRIFVSGVYLQRKAVGLLDMTRREVRELALRSLTVVPIIAVAVSYLNSAFSAQISNGIGAIIIASAGVLLVLVVGKRYINDLSELLGRRLAG